MTDPTPDLALPRMVLRAVHARERKERMAVTPLELQHLEATYPPPEPTAPWVRDHPAEDGAPAPVPAHEAVVGTFHDVPVVVDPDGARRQDRQAFASLAAVKLATAASLIPCGYTTLSTVCRGLKAYADVAAGQPDVRWLESSLRTLAEVDTDRVDPGVRALAAGVLALVQSTQGVE